MTWLDTFRELRAAMADPDRLGDVAVLKSELGRTRARPAVEAELAALGETFPVIDGEALAALPRGTLGREYAEFLRANGLHPFKLSDRISREMLQRNMFMARYGLTHDIFHVLTGFDTSLAGELGVWAFVAAQGYSRGHWLAVVVALVLYPILRPWQLLRIWRNLFRGVRMGRRARQLIAVPYETRWSTSVDQLRTELAVEPAPELDGVVVPG